MKILFLSFFLFSLLVGCAGQKGRIEDRGFQSGPLQSATREGNRLFQEALGKFYEADSNYSQALATSELGEKSRLLREAAQTYEQSLIILAKLRTQVSLESDRRRIDSLMEAAQLGQQNACDSTPVMRK
jgi:hypothetical protein